MIATLRILLSGIYVAYAVWLGYKLAIALQATPYSLVTASLMVASAIVPFALFGLGGLPVRYVGFVVITIVLLTGIAGFAGWATTIVEYGPGDLVFLWAGIGCTAIGVLSLYVLLKTVPRSLGSVDS